MSRKKATPKEKVSPKQEKKILKPKTDNHANYISTMTECDVVFCVGPAGSGKTCIAVGLACEYLIQKKISKIVISRPIVESGHGIGFLPGDMNSKTLPYMIPVLEEMNAYLGKENVVKLRAEGIIEVCPLEYMRGRNFHDSFIILDEGQNATFEQIKMFITRLGQNSKAIINGDPDQTDLRVHSQGGLTSFMTKLTGLQGVGMCQLTNSDIQRNELISRILERIK